MSITDKQLIANRANAQKSTGPKSDEGKARSSMNGRKHGFTGHATVTTDEDHEAWQEFSVPYFESLKPVGPGEIQLARTITIDQFRLNRLKAIEENMYAYAELGPLGDKIDAEHPRVHHALVQSQAFVVNDRHLRNLSLYEQRITSHIHRNLKLLREEQARRKAEEEYIARTEPKSKPLTLTGPLYGDLSRTASNTNEENGFDFSITLSKAKEAIIAPPKAA